MDKLVARIKQDLRDREHIDGLPRRDPPLQVPPLLQSLRDSVYGPITDPANPPYVVVQWLTDTVELVGSRGKERHSARVRVSRVDSVEVNEDLMTTWARTIQLYLQQLQGTVSAADDELASVDQHFVYRVGSMTSSIFTTEAILREAAVEADFYWQVVGKYS